AKKKSYLLILFLLYALKGFSQDDKYLITGQIFNKSTNAHIEKASIYIIDIKNNLVVGDTESDSSGNFQISFDRGNYMLSISYKDFEIILTSIDYSKFKENTLNLGKIQLKPMAEINLDEVVVTADDFSIENKKGKRVYHIGNKLKDVAGSMSNLLSYLPSIYVDIDGTVQLRGKDPIVKINGRNSNLSKSEALQMLPSDMIKRIEVVTRPSVKDGETKPVINIITDRKRKGFIGGANLVLGLPETIKSGIHLALNKEKINGYGLYGIKKEYDISSSKEESLRKIADNESDLEVETNDISASLLNQFGELQYEYLPNENSELIGNVSIFNI
ncbi:carboxypeptidase-like regulatory domain-containing protein, partial [Xanthovirga aplysinae]|uniref:carboxypeptidase-like regulatory domain-containing protein n=1 Tax=Xanthovirga aplysinae TaxID=2529853 RepID=UPI0016569A7C